MTGDRRTADRKDLDAMTRAFLDKGGQIVQCPPGSSENVVYKRGSFKRRAQNAAGANGAAPNGAAPDGAGPNGAAPDGAAPDGAAGVSADPQAAPSPGEGGAPAPD